MSTATWYVHSRGRRRADDYQWLPISGAAGSTGKAESARLTEVRRHRWYGATLDDLADDESPSLVLAYAREVGLVVYITRLGPVEPVTDSLHRPIRAAVIGVGTPASASDVVAVAAAALAGELSTLDGLNYELAEEPGFRLDPATWSTTVARCIRWFADLPADGPERPDKPRVDADRPDTRERIARELRSLDLSALAGRRDDLILVLRTPLLQRADHDRRRPWRVLAELSGAPAPATFTPAWLGDQLGGIFRSGVGWAVGLVTGAAVLVVAAVLAWPGSASQPTPAASSASPSPAASSPPALSPTPSPVSSGSPASRGPAASHKATVSPHATQTAPSKRPSKAPSLADR
ncbi:hypothetical protein [Hamadaea tsunoensis]|uniref:hypothetical protein n=1 Tax=Hamadaea tsunoensis TaxID=53368 RepID=UPI000405B725|nr:hypothetical protein [Hamadaea tsunoensis]